jgi:hypothetical protein
MTERLEEQRLPVWLGSAVVVRESTLSFEGQSHTHICNVEVHVYRFRRPKRFPLTRNMLLKLIDTNELEYRVAIGGGKSCCWKFMIILVFVVINIVCFLPFMLVVSPFLMIYEMIGAHVLGLVESDLYEREWFRIDSYSWCLLLLRQCLETDPVEAGPSPVRVSAPPSPLRLEVDQQVRLVVDEAIALRTQRLQQQ